MEMSNPKYKFRLNQNILSFTKLHPKYTHKVVSAMEGQSSVSYGRFQARRNLFISKTYLQTYSA